MYKVRIIYTFFFLMVLSKGMSQNLIPFQDENSKWGFKNSENIIVQKPAFDNYLELCSEVGNYYLVNNGGKLDSFTSISEEVVEFSPDPDDLTYLIDSLILVETKHPIILGGMFGLINPKGNLIVDLKYTSIKAFIDYFYRGNFFGESLILITEKEDFSHILDYLYSIPCLSKKQNVILIKEAEKWGIINYEGNQLLSSDYDSIKYQNDDVFTIYSNGLTGFYFINTNKTVEPQFDDFILASAAGSNKSFYFVNSGGVKNTTKILGKPEWITIYDEDGWEEDRKIFTVNYVPYFSGGKIGVIDTNGDYIFKPVYNDIRYCIRGFYLSLVDTNGYYKNEVYDRNIDPENNVVVTVKDNKVGLSDNQGNTLIKNNYERLEAVGNNFIAQSGKKLFLFDKTGKKLLKGKSNQTFLSNYSYKAPDKLTFSLSEFQNDSLLNLEMSILLSEINPDDYILYADDIMSVPFQSKSFDSINFDSVSVDGLIINIERYFNEDNSESNFLIVSVEVIDSVEHVYFDEWYGEEITEYKPVFNGVLNFDMLEISKYLSKLPNLNKLFYSLDKLLDDWGKELVIFQEDDFCYGVRTKSGHVVIEPVCTENWNYYFTIHKNIITWGNSDIYTKSGKRIFNDLDIQEISKVNEHVFVLKVWRDTVYQQCLLLVNEETHNIYYSDIVGDNSEGLILVSKGDKFGYIDSSGNEVVEVKYDLLNSFNGNFAIAKNQEKFGIISREGAEIIPCIYDDIFNFNIDGIAYLKQNNQWYAVSKNEPENLSKVIQNDKDYNSILFKRLIGYNYDFVGDYYDGLAKVKKNEKYGFIDKTGKLIIPCIYDWVSDFENSYARIYFGSMTDKGEPDIGHYNIIDKNNSKLLKEEYDIIGGRREGKYPVCSDSLFGYIDSTGKVIIPLEYENAFSFINGKAVVIKNDKRGKINENNELIIDFKYNRFFNPDEKGFSKVILNEKYGFIDEEGKEVIPIKFENTYDFNEDLVRVKLNGKWGVIDRNGRFIIEPKYSHIYHDFTNGFLPVIDSNKYLFVDKKGNEELIGEYDLFYTYSDDYDVNSRGDKMYFINLYNRKEEQFVMEDIKFVTDYFIAGFDTKKYGFLKKYNEDFSPFEYDYIENLHPTKNHYRTFIADTIIDDIGYLSLSWGTDKGKCGIVDQYGFELVPCKYQLVEGFENGYAKVRNRKYGVIDRSGKEVIPLIYDYIEVENNCIIAGFNDKNGMLDFSGNVLTPFEYYRFEFFESDFGFVQKEWLGNYALVKNDGTVLTDFIYEEKGYFKEGLCNVKIDGKYGYIDTTGSLVIENKFENASSFNRGLAKVGLNGKRAIINRKGDYITGFDFYDYEISKNYIIASTCDWYSDSCNYKEQILDIDGQIISTEEYDKIWECYYNNGLLRLFSGETSSGGSYPIEGKFGVYNANTKKILAPCNLDWVLCMSDDNPYMLIYKGEVDINLSKGKFGLMDTNGKMIIPIKYNWIYSFQENVTRVFIGEMEWEGVPSKGKFCLVNKKGKELIPFKYDWIYEFHNGLAKVSLNDKFGYINMKGEEVIPLQFDQAENFENEKARVELNSKVFYINTSGKCIENCTE